MKKTNFYIIFLLQAVLLAFSVAPLQAQSNCGATTVIGAIPYNFSGTTCGAGNDFASGSYCGSSSYGNGQDYVFELNVTTAPVDYDISLSGLSWTVVSAHTACPPTSGNCVDGVSSSASSKMVTVNFPTNGTYYIYVDTWPSPDCGAFTLDIAPPPPAITNLSTSGCDMTVVFTQGPLDIEVCPDYLPAGDPGCTTYASQTSPAVIDICAINAGGFVTVSATNASGSGSSALCLPSAPACPNQVLLFEDFETDGGGFSPYNASTGAGWNRRNTPPGSGNGPLNTTCGDWFIYWETTSTGPLPDVLNFPSSYDLTNATSANLDFIFHGFGSSTTSINVVELQVSTDGGATFTSPWSHSTATNIPAAAGDPFVAANVDLTPFIGNVVDLRLVGTVDQWFSDIAFDLFSLTAVLAPTIDAVNATGGLCGGGTIPTIEILTTHCGAVEYSIDNGATWSANNVFSDWAYDNLCFDIVVRDVANPSLTATYVNNQVCFNDMIDPVAVCQDIDVQLVSGTATITASDVDGGTTDNCGIDNLAIDITDFDCTHVGDQTVTFTVTDLGGNTDQCTSTVTVLGDDSCIQGFSNEGGATIADPCTCRGDGEFDEEVVVNTGVAGQAWEIVAVTGLSDGAGTDFAAGDLLTDNGDGTYSLIGVHLDGVGYSLEVSSPLFPNTTLTISNTCFYPDPVIENDLSILCPNTDTIVLAGSAGAGVAGTGTFTIDGTAATELIPSDLTLGSHEIEFCFDAGDALGFTVVNGTPVGLPDGADDLAGAEADPGCIECVSQFFTIQETPETFACNDNVQITANENCETEITPDMILEGGGLFLCYDDYTVALKNVPNPVPNSYFGRPITATVMHLPSGNTCWGSVIVEDKTGPQFNCTVDITDKMGNVLQSGQTLNIDCEIDPATIPAPEAIDNCDGGPIVWLTSEVETGDKCNVLTLTRTYGSKDNFDNQGNTCVITINITQPQQVRFPDDITWTCQQYEAHASIVDPTALHALILANAASMDLADYCCLPGLDGDDMIGRAPYEAGVEYWTDGEDLDVVLDPLYDDFLQNPITDSDPACDNIVAETDSDECFANFGYLIGCPYLQDCNLDPGGHVPNNISTPIYFPPFPTNPQYPSNHPIRGLEDNDVLEDTGSGVPSVSASGTCAFAVTHQDDLLEACDGIATDKVFKILRTWTVLNWCTGEVFTDVQVIKVLDKKPPVVVFNDDDNNDGIADETSPSESYGNDDGYNDELKSDIYGNGIACTSSGLIDVPTYLDDCTGVQNVRVFTPAGEATAVEVNGQVIGYRIPAPYLTHGIHTITFEVTDGCGNSTTVDKRVNVIDGVPPVNICREVTQIALSSEDGGLTTLNAEHFNEASYDNCSPLWFKVRRMERFGCDAANVDDTRPGNEVARNQEWFDDKVKFCCEDIGDTVMVILRAYDIDPGTGAILTNQSSLQHSSVLNYNYNDCMVEVHIEDKALPTCVPPEDVWTTCMEVPANLDLTDTDQLTDAFGSAFAIDNCNATITELTPSVDVDLCGVGTVTRRFRAEDDYGNRSLGSCTQTIMIMNVTEYELRIPGDFQEECDDASPGTVEYTEIGCDLIAINIEDQEFPVSDAGECKKIVRTYQIIDWCVYNGYGDPTEIPRLDINLDGRVGDGYNGSTTPVNHSATNNWYSTGQALVFVPNPLIAVAGTGYYQYIQHIKIYDDTAPEVSYDGDTQFCGGDLDEDPCTGDVNINPTTSDLCTNVTTRWELTTFSNTFSTADFSGDDALTGRYPLGEHTARFFVEDECGNVAWYDVTFTIIDCKAPTPACYNGLSIDVMPLSGMVELWASDFDASSFDYCHPIKYAINRITDLNGDGFIDSNDHLTTVPSHDSIQVTCSDLGIVNVQLWVGEVSSDDVNNWDYCVTYIEVQDNNGVCGTGNRIASVTGSAKTADGADVTNVDVAISGDANNSMTTDNSGAFNFGGLVRGNDYTVTPMRTDDIRNGVSTFDLALISKHILHVQPLNSPYKVIAADANNSGSISTLDLLAIRKIILHVSNEFPNNTSWRFIDKDQILDANPLDDVLAEVKNFNNIAAGNHRADFVAVKIGDVNNDAEPQSISGVDNRTFNGTFFLNTQDESFKAGDRVEATFSSEELSQIEGYQFTMNFNTKVLDLVEVIGATATKDNFGLTMVDNGIVTASWNGNAKTDEAFTLVFAAKAASTLSDELSVSSQYTVAEAYVGADLKNVGFNFGTSTSVTEFALYQNTPNPFRSETTIGFNLPEASEGTVTVTDLSGKVLRVIQGEYVKGYNQVELDMTNNLPAGVLIYELETSTHKATRKMTVVK